MKYGYNQSEIHPNHFLFVYCTSDSAFTTSDGEVVGISLFRSLLESKAKELLSLKDIHLANLELKHFESQKKQNQSVGIKPIKKGGKNK